MKQAAKDHARAIYDLYARDVSPEDLQRLFTHDTRDAYRFFTRGVDEDAVAQLPWWKRIPEQIRQIFLAFTLKLPPARRVLYLGALVTALIGALKLFRGFAAVDFPLGLPFIQIGIAIPVWADGTFAIILASCCSISSCCSRSPTGSRSRGTRGRPRNPVGHAAQWNL